MSYLQDNLKLLLHISCIHFGADKTFLSTMVHIASKNLAQVEALFCKSRKPQNHLGCVEGASKMGGLRGRVSRLLKPTHGQREHTAHLVIADASFSDKPNRLREVGYKRILGTRLRAGGTTTSSNPVRPPASSPTKVETDPLQCGSLQAGTCRSTSPFRRWCDPMSGLLR